jgi:molybdopterin biosynthesis enzyme MoaB
MNGTKIVIGDSDHVHSFIHSDCRLAAFHVANQAYGLSLDAHDPIVSADQQMHHKTVKIAWHRSECSLCLGGTGLDEYDITVLDNVVLALGHDLALRL